MLNASIVLYYHSPDTIKPLVETLQGSNLISNIFLIDNSPSPHPDFEKLPVTYIFTGKNVGYGAGHNIAIRETMKKNVPYHLVVNPDVAFEPEILEEIVEFMDKNTNIGLLMPKILYPDGEIQYLCKLLPSPFDLIFRRFLPKSLTRKRTEKFEMRASGYDKVMDVPYLSGCFMFFRTDALREVGLFDERFFLYPEDIDLTRRIRRKFRTVFYPHVSVVHYHERGSYKNLRMLWIHIINMIKYFNKWGWFCDAERKRVNRETMKQYFSQCHEIKIKSIN
ncbi:MAG TPA: glycosyltransferase family 2 protein [Paludibacteraceae bacterium]|nr:glycosyltransferase family 2 protein [Paludibacteraceae bacterium]